MRRRFLQFVGVAAVIIAVIGLLKLGAPGGGTAATTGPALKTSWGEPDLQGLWTTEVQIPLERPPEYAGREFFTDAEIADLNKRRAEQPTFSTRSAPRGTEQDVAGAYGPQFQRPKKVTGRRTSLIVDPPDGRIPPLTPEVQKRMREQEEYRRALLEAAESCKHTQDNRCAGVKYTGKPSSRRTEPPPHYLPTVLGPINRADGPEDFGLGERCLSGGLPTFDGLQEIGQSPGSVSIFYDGWQRVIPVTSSPHLPPHIRQWRGDARGRWEGDTLVVDVTNFTAKTDFRGSRENLHLIERFTRIDANTLEYVVTIEDPATWTKPWTVKLELKKQNEQTARIFSEPRCQEGNHGLVGSISGARADDKAFAEGTGPDPATKCYVECGFELAGQERDILAR